MNTVSTLRNSIAVLVEADKSEQKFRRSIPLWLQYIVQIGQLRNIDTLRYDQKRTLRFFVYLMRYRYRIFSFCFRAIFSLDSFILSLCKVKCIVCIFFEITVFNIYRDIQRRMSNCVKLFFFLFFFFKFHDCMSNDETRYVRLPRYSQAHVVR